jgi:hypothetical protein
MPCGKSKYLKGLSDDDGLALKSLLDLWHFHLTLPQH